MKHNIKHKYSYEEKSAHTIENSVLGRSKTKTNNATPRIPVNIDFAAKQFFQILLMDIKSRHALYDKVEPVASAISL